MKTTTNIFKSRVQAHIIDRLGNPWDEDTQSEKENATTAEKLKKCCRSVFELVESIRTTPNPEQTSGIY